MIQPLARSLLVCLAAILLMALGVGAPGAALAHAGHGEHAGRAAAWRAVDGGGSLAPLVFAAAGAIRGEAPHSLAVVAPGDAMASAPCGGAACCMTGHGCCSAIPVVAPIAPALPCASRLVAHLASLPRGLPAPAPPEPPRPFR